MRKIVCVHLLNDFSGSTRVLAGVIPELRGRGAPVEVLTNRGGRGLLTGLDATVRPFPYRRSRSPLATLVTYLWSQVVLFAMIFRYRAEPVTVCVNTLLPFGAALAAKLLGLRVVYYVHETSLRPRLLKAWLRQVARWTADTAIFVSHFLLEAERIPGAACTCIPNSLPDSLLREGALRDYDPLPGGRLNVLMVASPRDYKGIPEFLQVAGQIAGDRRIDFDLLLNASRREIEDYFRARPLPPNVRVHPGTREVGPFYARAGLLLNLSRTDEWIETFGLTILEAMAFGVPVIVPPAGGPLELVDEGVEGYRIEGRRIGDVVGAIRDLAGDPGKCRRFSAACRRKAARFGAAEWSQQVAEVFGV